MKESEYIRDYLNLFILEKIKKTDEIVSSFPRHVQTTSLKTNNDDEVKTKQTVDAVLLQAIGNESDQSLELPEVRARIIDKAHDSINSVVRQNFQKIIAQNVQVSSRKLPGAFDPKLILSEIFMLDDGQPAKLDKSLGAIQESNEFKDGMGSALIGSSHNEKFGVAEFERDLKTFDFKSMNCKKAYLFFDILMKYNFKLDFGGDHLENYEGQFLKLIYADDENLNYFTLKKSYFSFMRAFVEHFQIDFEARLKGENLMESPNLVLLASFSPLLCQHLDKLDFVEQLMEKLETLLPDQHHIYLKIFLNLFKNKSLMIQKLTILKIFHKLLEAILESDVAANISLFSILMAKASKVHLNTKQFISRDLLRQLFEKIQQNFSAYEDLKVIAIKNKNKPTEFKSGNSHDPVVLIDLYCKSYFDLIKQKLSIRAFKHMYYTALGFLKFISTFNAKLDDAQKQSCCRVIIDLLAVFYYQNNIVDASLISFKKLLSPPTIEFILEEFFETNLISNCFVVFERNDFSRKNIKTLSNFQSLLLTLIESCQMSGIFLKVRQIKKLLDRIYQIRQLVSSFYYNLKAKYLAKGLLKYVNKLKKSLMKDVVFPLDEILSQNALILQKLSHTQVLDENILFYANRNFSVGFDRQSEAGKVAQLVANGNQLLYIVSKVDRKDNYLEDIITFNLFLLEKLERFIVVAESSKENLEFDFVESIIEFLVINIYFVKTYDENYKKVTSMKVLKRTVELLVKILQLAKNFVNLQSNHQIYILLENLGLFWLLFFDFNYRFYDRLSFVFIDNLKTLTRQNTDNKLETFSSDTLYKILVFLNEFVDLKSKNSLLNFIIIKQLDTICLTLSNISNINTNFIVNIFQKVFSSNYGSEIHKLQQKYFLSLSVKVLSIDGIKQAFLDFVCKNTLYLNKYVTSILRNLLDKNFEIDQVKRLSVEQKNLFNFAVLEAPLDTSSQTTQFLLTLIQQNIRNKTLFEDLVIILRTHLKGATSAHNNEIVRKLFLSESIFWKLVRLYKKDQLNLSKILKYLLLICKHFNFLGEITIPPSVIKSILNTREINKFNDVYMLLLTYIFKNALFDQFKEDIDRFFTHTKLSLDNLLFFSKQISLDSNLRMIYYSLKVLKNCSVFVKGIPAIASIDPDDFITRYVLQIMDENNRLEIVPVNNLYHHFKKRETILANFKISIYESKIVNLLFSILRKNPPLLDALLEDFFVVNKLISFSYVVISSKTQEDLLPMITLLLRRGIQESNKELFKDIYYDFYLLLNYDFGYTDETLDKLVKEHLYDRRKSIVVTLAKLVEELRRKNLRFDTMGFNCVIRALLKVYYIVNECAADLYLENYQLILAALDATLEGNYKDVHSLTKLEKLFVNIYLSIYNKTFVSSVNSARVFLWLFNTHVEFKVSSLVDKYIYMGLFNSYLKQPKVEKFLRLDQTNGEISRVTHEQTPGGTLVLRPLFSFDSKKVTEALEQLRFKGLIFENEVILTKFLINLFKLDSQKFFAVGIKNEIVLDKIASVRVQLQDIFSQNESQLILLKCRLKFLLVFVKKEIITQQTEESGFLKEWMGFLPLVENYFSAEHLQSLLAEKLHLNFALLLLKFVRNLYKLAAIKNEAFMKPLLLQTFYLVWNQICVFKEDETRFKFRLKQAMLRVTLRIMRNRYDEMRFVLYRNFLPSIFEYFSNVEAEKNEEGQLPVFQPTGNSVVVATLEGQVNTERNNVENPSEVKQEVSAVEDAEERPKYSEADCLMTNKINAQGLVEPTLYLFYLVSRNNLLMNMEYKQQVFATIKERKERIILSKFCEMIYEFLEREYAAEDKKNEAALRKSSNLEEPNVLNDIPPAKQDESIQEDKKVNLSNIADPKNLLDNGNNALKLPSKEFEDVNPPFLPPQLDAHEPHGSPHKKPKDPLTIENASLRLKESSLAHKQKNILYVHKVLTTLSTSIDKNNKLSEREESYLTFGLVALHKHLLENLDPELFNAFGFFGLVSSFAVDDRVSVNFKRDCFEILKLFLATCESKNNVQPAETHGLLTFYERLLFDNYPETVQVYFEVLHLVFKYIKFPGEFVDDYMDKMSFCLFEAYSSIFERVFIAALAVFVQILQALHPKIDVQRVSSAVYLFLKINHKDMKFYERTLFVMLLAYFESQGIMDPIKFANASFFVKYSHTMEGLDKTPQALECLMQLTESCGNFQKLFKAVNFEAVYKTVFKHSVDNVPVLRTLTRLFLRYSYKIEENKFEMFECLRQILKNIRFFFRKTDSLENQELVILLYKSLVNASLLKENSEYLVKSDLSKVITECHYEQHNECAVVIISLLFNICYIFDRDEFQIKKFITPAVIALLLRIFEESLEIKNDATICELIDLFVGFIQHQFIDFFNLEMVQKIKLTLNLYYNSLEITLKFLNILRDITISGNDSVKNLVFNEFDFIYIYHIHYRNLKNTKINALTKHIILSLLNFRAADTKEQELVTFGIPENIIHTFSLEDPDNVMLLNLKIILLTLRFEKCLYFARNNFLAVIREIFFAPANRYKDDIIYFCLDILHELLAVFKDPQLLNCYYYFDQIGKLFDLMMFCVDNDQYLITLLKILKNAIDNDKEKIAGITKLNKLFMHDLITLKSKNKNRELLSLVYSISSFVDIHESIMEGKLNLTRDNKISLDDRTVLENGQSVLVYYRDMLHKNALIKFNFLKSKFNILNVDVNPVPKKTEKKKLSFLTSRIDGIGQHHDQLSEKIETYFRTYFMKSLKKELYFSFLLVDEDPSGVNHDVVFLIFENEYQCQKWRNLIGILAGK